MISNSKKIIKEYTNRIDVIEKAMSYLSESANPSGINEDWFDIFFDKVGLVSDEIFKK